MVFATNKKAHHDFIFEEKMEVGIELTGTEVKSIRNNKVQLQDAFVMISQGEAYLHHCHISPFDFGNRFNHEPTRPRKLLLHLEEIAKLQSMIQTQRVSVIPLKFYAKKRWIKVELGIGKGKKKGDKRASLKEKESKRDIDRALKRG